MRKVLLASLLALATSSAFAAGYGSAGCGLGSVIIGDKPGIVQIFATTTNGTSASQTFGITSGTSNCGSAGKSAEAFIEANKTSLSNDISRGQGESISTLASMMGVKNTAEFGTKLQASYKEIFKSSNSKEINAKIIEIVKANKLL
jgi:hypothetical protein